MGQVSELLLEDWQRQQEHDYKASHRVVAVTLTCCGAMIEVTATHTGEEQLITCPRKTCGKRHILLWGINPTLKSEQSVQGLL